MDSDLPILLDGQSNFRDLGGYGTADGRSVRYGQVYRSGRLVALSDADLARLVEVNLRTVVNLLTEEDRDVYGEDRIPDGATLVSLPIDSDAATELANEANNALRSGDFSALPPELNPEIHRLLVHDGADRYGKLVELIADPDRRALVFHCSHGVHRTGTGAAIVLMLAGVPWETVRADYLLSNTHRQAEVRHRLGQLRALAARNQEISEDQVDMTNAEAFLIQDGSYIDAVRDEIITEFGSFDGYAREALGLDASTIDDLRASLLR